MKNAAILGLVLVVLMLSACGKPFVNDPLESGELAENSRIGVLPINFLEKASVDVHDNIVGLAGTAGKIAVIKGRDTKRRKFTDALKEQRYVYQQHTNDYLIERLHQAGLDAHFMEFRRSIDNILEAVPPRRFEKRYPKDSDYDQLLDIYVDYVGFAAKGLDDPYLPTVHIAVRLVDAKTLLPVYQARIQYHSLEEDEQVDALAADESFGFKNFDGIIADIPRAKEGLQIAVAGVLDRMIEELHAD